MEHQRSSKKPTAKIHHNQEHHPSLAEHNDLSKFRTTRQTSHVSLTPSKADSTKSAHKNPLDALSKNVHQATVERRSGLQDVDEDYLKRIGMRNPIYTRNSGLDEYASLQKQTPTHAAGQPSTHNDPQQTQSQKQLPETTNHQTSQIDVAGGVSSTQKQGINQQIQNMQAPTQQQVPTQQQQQQQPQNQMPITSNATPPVPEGEICTTCPHCQATIYVVLGSDVANNDVTPQAPSGHQAQQEAPSNISAPPQNPQNVTAAGGN